MKQLDASKIWNAISARHTLFWNGIPARDERDYRLARLGLLISHVLLILLAIIEISFLTVLLWLFLK